MKVEQIKYSAGHQRLFYVPENIVLYSVIAYIFTPAEGEKEVWFRPLLYGVWDLDFIFKYLGKYVFVIFEDGIKTLVLIITIE